MSAGATGGPRPAAAGDAAQARSAARGGGRAAALWIEQRGRMFGIAYRMLGTVSDAEDVLQDAYVRLQAADLDRVEHPDRWVARVVSRLCLNRLTSAQARRERYVGPWLPEPLVQRAGTARSEGPGDTVELAESVSTAFLVVLEALSPAERVAFVLHDVFGYGHRDLAAALGRSEPACRQLVHRARRAVMARRPRFQSDPERRRRVAAAFLDATRSGDLAGLLALLAPDVVARTDGGGQVRAALRPVHGADRAARLLLGILRKRGRRPDPLPPVNGTPGVGLRDDDGRLLWVLALTVDRDDRISHLDLVSNPGKLAHLR